MRLVVCWVCGACLNLGSREGGRLCSCTLAATRHPVYLFLSSRPNRQDYACAVPSTLNHPLLPSATTPQASTTCSPCSPGPCTRGATEACCSAGSTARQALLSCFGSDERRRLGNVGTRASEESCRCFNKPVTRLMLCCATNMAVQQHAHQRDPAMFALQTASRIPASPPASAPLAPTRLRHNPWYCASLATL